MKLRFLLVGKPKDAEAGLLHDRYAGRIRRLGVPCETVWVPEVRPGGRYSDDHVREREARYLSEKLQETGRGKVIALDRQGRELTSQDLAERLERWASPLATFVIGGPLGLDDDFLTEAHWRWSLSPLTLPHELARVVAAEQLYRALTLIRRIPYHK
jgi:23S rRNA (pseudouridine1915-N3)-methyltransferase